MTEHERRIHDKTIKAYEQFGEEKDTAGLKMGQNYSAIQNKYIGKAFGAQGSPTGSPMMNNAKRPNLNEVVSVNPYQNQNTQPQTQTASQSSLLNENPSKRQPSQLALAGVSNLLGMSSTKGIGAPALS